ncbi:RNaseH domain-containing protein [Hamadaea sp. NPDC050747]|uniref:RNaseH domain-containing protein n=1 Tax=Hamadaea sp. NPDC050747 TaxID=3155789 RepID=UPI0033F04949
MLLTLGYRIPAVHIDSILGNVAAYPWTSDFEDAWRQMPRKKGRPPAYSQLLTGLTAAHGQPVRITDGYGLTAKDKAAGVKGILLSTKPFEGHKIRTCLRTWERLERGGEDRDSLSQYLPDVDNRPFIDYIATSPSGTATAPGWLYDTATWKIMQSLAKRLRLGGDQSIDLTLDTDGSLVGWDNLVTNTWDDWTAHAMLRVTARFFTLPTIGDLCISFDAHLSRIGDRWAGAKTAWIKQEAKGLPVLRLKTRNVKQEDGTWIAEVANHAAAIAEACRMENLGLPQELPKSPGKVRPLIAGPQIYPIGKGVGARVMKRLAEHIEQHCPNLQPLRWERDKNTRLGSSVRQVLGIPVDHDKATRATVSLETLAATVTAAGRARLRILCLYDSREARDRMTAQLSAMVPGGIQLQDGETQLVNARLAVSMHRCTDLLKHGNHDRSAALSDLKSAISGEPGIVVAWLETVFDPKARPEDDAKQILRGALAKMGVSTQFLATAPPDAKPKRASKRAKERQEAKPTDHPAVAANADLLLRMCGTVHPKLSTDLIGDLYDNTTHETVHLVGIHARLQHSGREGVPPRLVTTAVAIQTFRDPVASWVVRMWSDSAQRWLWQPEGIADFHAGPIGSTGHGRSGDKAVATRMHMESLLDALPPGHAVLFADAASMRTIYPGLQNHSFADALLPGLTLSAARDVAIVRVNTNDEVARPVHRDHGKQSADPGTPSRPDRYLYRLPGTDIWLLAKSSRGFRAFGGTIGAAHTPWTLPDDLRYLIEKDRHAFNGTEIVVAQHGGWTERQLVTLTARLCDRPLHWDDQTEAPMPLHLARLADKTHPYFRSDDEDSGGS